jgi:hypothetical protein
MNEIHSRGYVGEPQIPKNRSPSSGAWSMAVAILLYVAVLIVMLG